MSMLNLARDEIRKERKRETKKDTTVKIASILHDKGKEGREKVIYFATKSVLNAAFKLVMHL